MQPPEKMSDQSAERRVGPWGRGLAGPGREDLYLTAEETESGVDLLQLRRNLALTPTERLVKAAQLYESWTRMREVARLRRT